MDPFLPKKETEYVDDIFVKKTIKEKLNKPRKEVKFTWEGLKNFVPFLETNPFDPLKVKRIKELTEGAPAKEKDYIEGYEEIEKALYGGVQDLGYSVSSLLTEGIDAAFDTKYLDALDEHQPDILGMSALLTTPMPYMKVVIATLEERGLRDKYFVLVGGAPLSEEFGEAVGADAYCRDAAVTVEVAKELMTRKHNQLSEAAS